MVLDSASGLLVFTGSLPAKVKQLNTPSFPRNEKPFPKRQAILHREAAMSFEERVRSNRSSGSDHNDKFRLDL
jgi:hypothetical protein